MEPAPVAIEPDLHAQEIKKNRISKLRADMSRKSQQLDKILAHPQSGEEDYFLEKHFQTARREEATGLVQDYESMEFGREPAASAMLVTEHSADGGLKAEAQLVPHAVLVGSPSATNDLVKRNVPRRGSKSGTANSRRSRFFSAKHPVNRQAKKTSFIFRPEIVQGLEKQLARPTKKRNAEVARTEDRNGRRLLPGDYGPSMPSSSAAKGSQSGLKNATRPSQKVFRLDR